MKPPLEPSDLRGAFDGGGIFPIMLARLQQIECPHNIRLDEVSRSGNGAIHMRFRREMQHMRYLMLLHDPQYVPFIAQVHFLENVLGMPHDWFKVCEMPRVGETI